jgi:hypothetical protein
VLSLSSGKSSGGKSQLSYTSGNAPSGPISNTSAKSQNFCIKNTNKGGEGTPGQRKSLLRKNTTNTVNYIEKNKKGLENLIYRAASSRKVTDERVQQMQQHLDTQMGAQLGAQLGSIAEINMRKTRSKVNSGLQRSKSSTGNRPKKMKTMQEQQQPKYRLDLTQQERLEDDLKRKITSEMKEGIKSLVDSKYADLENELSKNLVYQPQPQSKELVPVIPLKEVQRDKSPVKKQSDKSLSPTKSP